MDKKWSKLTLSFSSETNPEILIAWLDIYQVDSIVEYDDYFEVYCAEDAVDDLVKHIEVNELLQIDKVEVQAVENKNWNAEWEANFDPIIVDKVGVRATFHETLSTDYEIVISPKMAFGTGHHATTYMMLEEMQSMDFKNKTVLDYGCGTGILAVFALMKESSQLCAIDIQEEAIENTAEHVDLNQLDASKIEILQKDINELPTETYDIILANINHRVLQEQKEEIVGRLRPKSTLLLSGILIEDQNKILEQYLDLDLNHIHTKERGEWCMINLSPQKPTS